MRTLVRTNRGLLPQFPSIMDDFFTGDIFNWPMEKFSGKNIPSVNVKETDGSYEVEVAAPGLAKDNFKVELNNDLLTISAQRESNHESQSKEGKYTRKEFNYESFKRSFQLPEHSVEKDKISAKYQNGILHLTLPKSAESKNTQPRTIEIA